MDEFSIIGHIDMDAFFASVEELDKPWLSGLPIVVGSDPQGGKGRGVVSTANYKAREYGIHSALPITKAWELSERARKSGKPAVAFLGSRFKRYSEISDRIFSILATFTPTVLKVGSDEGYFDLTEEKTFDTAREKARKIQETIFRETGLTASIGVGGNKLIAKIASDYNKPNGLTVVKDEEAPFFLAPLPLRKIPGIGPKTEQLLLSKRMRTVGDVQKKSFEELELLLGKTGISLFEKVRGIGSVDLMPEGKAKSIGEHITFPEDTKDMKYILQILNDQAARLITLMEKQGFSGFKTTVLTIRFSDFETKNRSLTGTKILTTEKELSLRALKLALPFFTKTENPKNKAIRLVGLRIEKLV